MSDLKSNNSGAARGLFSRLLLPLLSLCFCAAHSLHAANDVAERSSAMSKADIKSFEKAQALAAEIKRLDATLWSDEVEAQEHEKIFVALWDTLRNSKQKLLDLATLQFEQLVIAEDAMTIDLMHGIKLMQLQWSAGEKGKVYDYTAFKKSLKELSAKTQLIQSEWHHSAFHPAKGKEPAKSVVSMELHLRSGASRLVVRGPIHISWKKTSAPQIDTITVKSLEILKRAERAGFKRTLKYGMPEGVPNNISLAPLIVKDIDNNGFLDILLPGINSVLKNKGNFDFEEEDLFGKQWVQMRAAHCADFTGDGLTDCIGVENNGPSVLHHGKAGGGFKDKKTQPWRVAMTAPRAITSGDIDGDGDLDLFVGQYKSSYLDGQMPTPFYDANDGFPAYLLINDGKGNFKDETEKRFKGLKRQRRSFTASFVDVDYDRDLDLLVVSDFSGVDLYINDGRGQLREQTQSLISEPKSFGMCHAFANFDGDEHFDLYVAGMSSTTARRLQNLGLERKDFPKHTEMRERMTYGNRLYQRVDGRNFMQTSLNTNAARAGWTWAVGAFDLENDGFDDIYVANGHMSGKSATDYCTRYWSHDIYLGDSKERKEIELLFGDEFLPEGFSGLYDGEISWNGFEKNRLYLNVDGRTFLEGGFLFDVAMVEDGRAVLAEDLDNDGRKDLVVMFLNRDYTDEDMNWRPELAFFKNTLETNNNWIGIRVSASEKASPYGAMVRIEGDFGVRERPVVNGDVLDGQGSTVIHFGIGKENVIKQAVITWQSGNKTVIANPGINAYHNAHAK